MQFRWNHTQGAPDYDRETGFGFVTGAVYNADAGLHIPETNSGFLPLWWYAGTPISDIQQSEYGLQLREKQKCRRAYGISESQFRKYYDMASNMRGITGDNMLCLLERRLDNVVYRLGFAMTRRQARQLVNHGHIRVDGQKVDIASYLVKPGQTITVRERSRDMANFKDLREQGASKPIPKWLELDSENLTGKIAQMPQRDDIDLTVEEHLIVEFYSR